MTNDQIEKIVQQKNLETSTFQISFRARNSIQGMFIKTADFSELKSKNLWRIVSESSIPEYKKSKDTNLARIFNGTEITRLSVANN